MSRKNPTDIFLSKLLTSSPVTLSENGLLECFSYKYYGGQKWEPQIGDFYVIGRNSPPHYICQITRETYQKLYTVMLGIGQDESETEWTIEGFSTKNFGPHRLLIPPYMFKFPEFFEQKVNTIN